MSIRNQWKTCSRCGQRRQIIPDTDYCSACERPEDLDRIAAENAASMMPARWNEHGSRGVSYEQPRAGERARASRGNR